MKTLVKDETEFTIRTTTIDNKVSEYSAETSFKEEDAINYAKTLLIDNPEILRSVEVLETHITSYSEKYINPKIIERDMARECLKELPEILELKSDKIPFIRLPYIYFLIKDNKIIYIGQSINITQRINDHYKNKDFDFVTTIEVGRSDLSFVEYIYIQKYNPPLNIQGVVKIKQ